VRAWDSRGSLLRKLTISRGGCSIRVTESSERSAAIKREIRGICRAYCRFLRNGFHSGIEIGPPRCARTKFSGKGDSSPIAHYRRETFFSLFITRNASRSFLHELSSLFDVSLPRMRHESVRWRREWSEKRYVMWHIGASDFKGLSCISLCCR